MKNILIIFFSVVALLVIMGIFLMINDGETFLISDGMRLVFIALFLLPVVVAFIFSFVIVAHSPSYFARTKEQEDSLLHQAVGLLVAITQDFSRGEVAEPPLYAPELLQMVNVELEQYRVFLNRGHQFHFAFYHQEHYEVQVAHVITASDVVIEIAGMFDHYFERDGVKQLTPHEFDARSPLVRVPGMVRLRIAKQADLNQWQLVGFSENIRGMDLGLATH